MFLSPQSDRSPTAAWERSPTPIEPPYPQKPQSDAGSMCFVPSMEPQTNEALTGPFNPFRTAVPFLGQTTQISSRLSPKRDCGTKGVKAASRFVPNIPQSRTYHDMSVDHFQQFLTCRLREVRPRAEPAKVQTKPRKHVLHNEAMRNPARQHEPQRWIIYAFIQYRE